jgi:hypothetical protein
MAGMTTPRWGEASSRPGSGVGMPGERCQPSADGYFLELGSLRKAGALSPPLPDPRPAILTPASEPVTGSEAGGWGPLTPALGAQRCRSSRARFVGSQDGGSARRSTRPQECCFVFESWSNRSSSAHNTHAHSACARRGNATNPITAGDFKRIYVALPYGAIQRTLPSLSLTITAEPPG